MTDATPATPRIVIGVDGSSCSTDALRWAARMASTIGAQLDVVGVWDDPTTYGWSALPPLYPPHPALEKMLNESVDEVFGADRPAGLRIRVLEGSPAPALINASHHAEMLVVGSRGLGGLAGLLLGSVSAKVAEYATCPVLVVHDAGDAAAAR